MDNIELKYSGITLTLHFFRTKRRKNTINQRILNKYLKCTSSPCTNIVLMFFSVMFNVEAMPPR